MAEPNGTTDAVEGGSGVPPDPGPPIAPMGVNSLPSNKCSGLPNGGFFKNGTSFLKSKNYKAGSKINQLADMLAKRSQGLVTSQLGSSNGLPLQVHSVDPEPPRDVAKSEEVAPPPLSGTPPPSVEARLETPTTPPTALDDYENSTKVKVVKTRTSPRCRMEIEPQQTDSVVKRGKTKQQRRSKKLVEMSTQTAEIQFISIRKEEEEKSPLPPPNSVESDTFVCLYCHKTFSEIRDCKDHELVHSQKRKTKCIKCQFCPKKLPKLDEFILHATKTHPTRFLVCLECSIRFADERKLLEHLNSEHPSEEVASDLLTGLTPRKSKLGGPALNVDVNCEGGKKPTPSPRSNQKLSPRDRSEEQYEAEMLFYSHLSGNIQENLSKHLDGKIDQTDVSVLDCNDPQRSKNGGLLSVVASSAAAAPVYRAPSPYQTRSKTPNPLPMSAKKFKKLPNWQQKFWEKYNFPTNYGYEHRFWDKNYLNNEKSSLYLKDLSCLDIKTQLTVRENAARLEETANTEPDVDLDGSQLFSSLLCLSPRKVAVQMVAEPVASTSSEVVTAPLKKGKTKLGKKARPSAQGQVVTRLQSGGDVRQRKGSLDLSGDKKKSLRRQTSLENLDGKKGANQPQEISIHLDKDSEPKDEIPECSVITGEWVRPRSYLCGTCHSRFDNLWELEDHKWATHPNVWSTHYEFEDEKLEKLFKLETANPEEGQIKLPDLYRRHLGAKGALNCIEPQPATSLPHPCSKCKKVCSNMSDLHKHMLDCGGDTTWFQTMYSSPNASMKRKWRPFGSKRKKQQIGRRCLKRSVPSTPTLRSYCTQPKVRTKPGDVETIQKMLANLPEKRIRRAINFDEISTRSQATIHSNRLLRKRLNATFTSNFLRRKALTRIRSNMRSSRQELAGGKTSSDSSKTTSGASSNTTSDVSSETTPTSSPRRKFRLKDVTIDVAPLTISDREAQGSVKNVEGRKKVGVKKKKKAPPQKKKPIDVKTENDEDTTVPKPPLKVQKRTPAVRTKADIVKKIKKKLRNSKRLLDARQEKEDEKKRRSARKKIIAVPEEGSVAISDEEPVIFQEEAVTEKSTAEEPQLITKEETAQKRKKGKPKAADGEIKAKKTKERKQVVRKNQKKSDVPVSESVKKPTRKLKEVIDSVVEFVVNYDSEGSAESRGKKTETQSEAAVGVTPSIANSPKKSSPLKQMPSEGDISVTTSRSSFSRQASSLVEHPCFSPSRKPSSPKKQMVIEMEPPSLSPTRKPPAKSRHALAKVEMPSLSPGKSITSLKQEVVEAPKLNTTKRIYSRPKVSKRRIREIRRMALMKRKGLKGDVTPGLGEGKEPSESIIVDDIIQSADESSEGKSRSAIKTKSVAMEFDILKVNKDPENSTDGAPLIDLEPSNSREPRTQTPKPSRRMSRVKTPIPELLTIEKEPKDCDTTTAPENVLANLIVSSPGRKLSRSRRSSSEVSLLIKEENETDGLCKTPEKVEAVEADIGNGDLKPGRRLNKPHQQSVEVMKGKMEVLVGESVESSRRSPRGSRLQESAELLPGEMSPPKTSPPKSKKAYGINAPARDAFENHRNPDRKVLSSPKKPLDLTSHILDNSTQSPYASDNPSDDEFLIPSRIPSKGRKKVLASTDLASQFLENSTQSPYTSDNASDDEILAPKKIPKSKKKTLPNEKETDGPPLVEAGKLKKALSKLKKAADLNPQILERSTQSPNVSDNASDDELLASKIVFKSKKKGLAAEIETCEPSLADAIKAIKPKRGLRNSKKATESKISDIIPESPKASDNSSGDEALVLSKIIKKPEMNEVSDEPEANKLPLADVAKIDKIAKDTKTAAEVLEVPTQSPIASDDEFLTPLKASSKSRKKVLAIKAKVSELPLTEVVKEKKDTKNQKIAVDVNPPNVDTSIPSQFGATSESDEFLTPTKIRFKSKKKVPAVEIESSEVKKSIDFSSKTIDTAALSPITSDDEVLSPKKVPSKSKKKNLAINNESSVSSIDQAFETEEVVANKTEMFLPVVKAGSKPRKKTPVRAVEGLISPINDKPSECNEPVLKVICVKKLAMKGSKGLEDRKKTRQDGVKLSDDSLEPGIALMKKNVKGRNKKNVIGVLNVGSSSDLCLTDVDVIKNEKIPVDISSDELKGSELVDLDKNNTKEGVVLKEAVPNDQDSAVQRFPRRCKAKGEGKESSVLSVDEPNDIKEDVLAVVEPIPELKEMPVLEKAEPVEKVVERVADDLPVLKPFEVAEAEQDHPLIRFKIVKKSKKNRSSSVKVSPLKIVKEIAPLAASERPVLLRKRQSLDGSSCDEAKKVESPKKIAKETDESGSDCEPLSKLCVLPTSSLKSKGKMSSSKQLVTVKPSNNTSQVEELPTDAHASSEEQTSNNEHPTEPPIVSKVASPIRDIQEAVMEKIIMDKLNEGKMRKRRQVSSHKRGKKHELKRLRMTVTLKEATLKVLDKPVTPLNPYKWTVSTPGTENINFEVPTTGETSKCHSQLFPILSPVPKDAIALIPGDSVKNEIKVEPVRSQNVSLPCQEESPAEVEVKVPVILPEPADDSQKLIEAPLTDIKAPTKVIDSEASIEKTEVRSRRSCRTNKKEVKRLQPLQRGKRRSIKDATLTNKSPVIKSDRSKSKEEVTTTFVVPGDEQTNLGDVLFMLPEEVSSQKPQKSFEVKPDEASEVDVITRSGPSLTIEEATSSEDGINLVKKTPCVSTPEVPKIAEADSSAMADDEVTPFQRELREQNTDEGKVEMEAVVSSTGPAIQMPKKKRRLPSEDSSSLETKEDVPSTTLVIPEELDRRSRRRSKEIPTNSEFVVDDPLILVDELWSDLDSDSDSKQRRKLRKIRKRVPKKKIVAPNEVDLEALLRNFGAKKEEPQDSIKCLRKKVLSSSGPTSRQCIEGKVVYKENSVKKLSHRLFSFNKKVLRFGHRGSRLLKVKAVLQESIPIPKLPLLSSQITENPEQVIVCRSIKAKISKKTVSGPEMKLNNNLQLKCSLPLDLIGDISVLNNNNVRERSEDVVEVSSNVASTTSRPTTPASEFKGEDVKSRRSDVIDKIFSCDICRTYYYSSSQLKNHKLSNRHRLKEAEVLKIGSEEARAEVAAVPGAPNVTLPTAKVALEVEKAGDDTSEMPVLEGPFIETGTEVRPESAPSAKPTLFGFSEESLKDIQKAIGCTDEEMLILTLLGDNNAASEPEKQEAVKNNGSLQLDLKQRMTTALASLVNKAVNNLLKTSESGSGTPSYKSETASFLRKLSELHCRKEKVKVFPNLADFRDDAANEKVEARYKYHCTICGNRFEKESTRDHHLNRTHRRSNRPKTSAQKAALEELTPPSEDWNDSWIDLEEPCGVPSSQFWCSDCGINFISPMEVREHQRLEHPPSAAEDGPRVRTPIPKRDDLDPDKKRLLANQELQKLRSWKNDRKCKRSKQVWGINSVKFRPSKTDDSGDSLTPKTSLGRDSTMNEIIVHKPRDQPLERFKTILANNAKRKTVEDVSIEDDAMDGTSWKAKKSMDVYDFNDSESEAEPMMLSHVRKFSSVTAKTASDEDSEDDLPLSSVKAPLKSEEVIEEILSPVIDETADKVEEAVVGLGSKSGEPLETTNSVPGSFKISLESRLLRLDEIPLKKPDEEGEESRTLDVVETTIVDEPTFIEDALPAPIDTPIPISENDDRISEDANDSLSSFGSHDDKGKLSDSDEGTESEVEDEDTTASEGVRRVKKIVPLLSATLTNNIRKSESPKFNKEVIVKKIWSRQRNSKPIPGATDESQSSEIDKETIMKRIWKKKRAEAEEEEKRELEMKINQTEVSDEVVIKCGPKPKPVSRRKSLNETKDVIVRRIWSGKCGFQTKAALKTYESDIVPAVAPAKRRGRPASLSAVKRKRVVSASEDDLDSLLEEIERENVEKAIRLDFLHLRRSDKNQLDNSKEPAGLFAETNATTPTEKRKRKIRRNVRVLKRREDLAELRNRKHKRHRHHHHQHHHRKHKHKKSRHHKRILSKHRSKHRGDPGGGGFKVLERMCEDIASRSVSEPLARRVAAGGLTDSRISTDLDNLDSKIDQVLSPLGTFEKRVNGNVSSSEAFGFPSEDESNQCTSNKDP